MRFNALLIIMMSALMSVFAQDKTEQVKLIAEQPCPDFRITGIQDFRLKVARITDFRGKWLILDFWDKNCMACVKSFPLVNARQRKYGDKIQYLLVGKQDQDGLILKIYERFRKRLDLRIAHTFDSLLFKKLDIQVCPHIVVVDPGGVIYGITNSLNEDQLTALIAGKRPQLNQLYEPDAPEPLRYRLSDMDDRADQSLLYKSALNKWNASIMGSSGRKVSSEKGYFEAMGRSIEDLYKIAYLGQDGLDVKDSLYGLVSDQLQVETLKPKSFLSSATDELYCYRVLVPPGKSNKNEIMRIMRNDLKSYFGYEVSIEDRNMPCWKLVATQQARKKLKTAGISLFPKGRVDTGFTAGNISVKKLLSFFILVKFDLPIMDETGIDGNIDITMNCLLTDENELRKGLKANGLDLERSEKKMKVIVIRDPAQPIRF